MIETEDDDITPISVATVVASSPRKTIAPMDKMERIAFIESLKVKQAKREEIGAKMIDFWEDLLNKPTDGPPKWSDKLKASENLAKYAGILVDQKPNNTINVLNVSPKEMTEEELRRELERIEAQPVNVQKDDNVVTE